MKSIIAILILFASWPAYAGTDQKTIDFLKADDNQLKDADHKAFIEGLLPVVEDHLKAAQDLLKTIETPANP